MRVPSHCLEVLHIIPITFVIMLNPNVLVPLAGIHGLTMIHQL